jgi:thioredoxin-related protein
MLRFVFCFFLLPLNVRAQSEKGIVFERFGSWQEVIAKAAVEHKMVFVDCYATWCGPCRLMDDSTFSDSTIAGFLNGKFISVKVQMDTTGKDNDMVKAWYHDASVIQKKYSIRSLPSFLFFSSDGNLVHKGVGYMEIAQFNSLVKDALDTSRQYFTQVARFRVGAKDYPAMPQLAIYAKLIGDTGLADTIAHDFINNYLLQNTMEQIYTRSNLEFVGSFISGSHDRAFSLFYNHGKDVDRVVREGYAQDMVDYIIAKEDIDPNLFVKGRAITAQPDWPGMYKKIKRRYDTAYANRTIINAKLRWYQYKKEWPTYAKCVIEKVERYGPYGFGSLDLQLNNIAWDIFQYSSDTVELRKALALIEQAIRISDVPNSANLDTKANILYKLGRRNDALRTEQEAIQLDPQNVGIKDNYVKMTMNKATW